MDFRIADTFTDSLARLTGEEQKAAKTTAFDLQLNPAKSGMRFHRLDRARDKRFWSVRVSRDLRIIVHRSHASLLLCYVGHHDDAYAWAERRRLETHPRTGAAQLVVVRETVREVEVPVYVQGELPVRQRQGTRDALFSGVADGDLLAYGVPAEWLADVKAATEDTLLGIAEQLPAEAAEALLELATGGKPTVPPASPELDPFEHPDARRRFRVMTNVEELGRALEYPWEKWTVFLHPQQRDWVERDYSGPARVSGSAGTGKTVVALHRAVHLARVNPEARGLLTTFSDALARLLQVKLRRLLGGEPRLRERIEVCSLDAVGLRLYRQIGEPRLVPRDELSEAIRAASRAVGGHRFSLHFLRDEWDQVVDAWQLASWEAYRDVPRLGRKTRLPEGRREVLWAIYERVREDLRERGLLTQAEVFAAVTRRLRTDGQAPFDFAVVDEAQDISVAQLKFLAALAGSRPNGLFFAGDLGQRIFQQPFSWKSLGVEITGRSRTLRVNYRTSHQIRTQADRLLGPEVTDVDGNTESRRHTLSVFNGPAPVIQGYETQAAETEGAAAWIEGSVAEGVVPHEIGVFVRSRGQLDRATAAVEQAGLAWVLLDDGLETVGGKVSVSTMHLAKGLEFRAAVVMACDDEVVPLQERIETVGDDADLQEVYDTERHLLYVACTRARDQLLVTCVEPGSEFLQDMAPAR